MAAGIPNPQLTFFPLARGNIVDLASLAFGVVRLPTDPIGTHDLTLENVVVDSRVHIESQDGTTVLYDAIAASSTVTPSLDVYSNGSALNDWRIRIRKGSAAPYYIPYETLMTATVGSSSIYVSQVAD